MAESFNNDAKKRASFMQIDYNETFDSVEHKFMFRRMRKMGFGDTLINLIKVSLAGCGSFANIDDHVSHNMTIGRGLRLGSLLSLTLFPLVGQVFTNNIKINRAIECIGR